MKRYDYGGCDACSFGELIESPEGDWIDADDLHAWALKHKRTVEGMEHVDGCASFFCTVCTWYCVTAHTPDDTDPTFHAAVPGECNCPRSDALREIEEIINA
jgi:hypothetical protein